MADTNWWLEFLRLLPSIVIGACVVIIAFMQWRTTHTNLIVNIFDNRLEIYAGILEAVAMANIDERGMREAHLALLDLRPRAAFLYGDEVTDIITSLITCIATQRLNQGNLENKKISDGERELYAKRIEDAANEQIKLSKEFRKVCAPYLRITAKHVRTPAKWFEDVNEARWSYADEKQLVQRRSSAVKQ